jgi:hypothetical protein
VNVGVGVGVAPGVAVCAGVGVIVGAPVRVAVGVGVFVAPPTVDVGVSDEVGFGVAVEVASGVGVDVPRVTVTPASGQVGSALTTLSPASNRSVFKESTGLPLPFEQSRSPQWRAALPIITRDPIGGHPEGLDTESPASSRKMKRESIGSGSAPEQFTSPQIRCSDANATSWIPTTTIAVATNRLIRMAVLMRSPLCGLKV